jgi:hypothetical protein
MSRVTGWYCTPEHGTSADTLESMALASKCREKLKWICSFHMIGFGVAVAHVHITKLPSGLEAK